MNRQNPILLHLVFVIVLLMIAFALAACRTTQPVAIPQIHERETDSVRTEYVHDSTHIDRWHTITIKGDTVLIHDSIDRWHDRFVYIHDSIDNSRIDTISQIVEIEKPQSIFLRNSGIALWVIIGVLILGVIIGIVIKFAK